MCKYLSPKVSVASKCMTKESEMKDPSERKRRPLCGLISEEGEQQRFKASTYDGSHTILVNGASISMMKM